MAKTWPVTSMNMGKMATQAGIAVLAEGWLTDVGRNGIIKRVKRDINKKEFFKKIRGSKSCVF